MHCKQARQQIDRLPQPMQASPVLTQHTTQCSSCAKFLEERTALHKAFANFRMGTASLGPSAHVEQQILAAAGCQHPQPAPTLIDSCQAAEILSKRMFERIRGHFDEITAVYPRANASDVVSSHNDLHPGNLLLQGDRAWLVDWEAALAADCFVDLAAVANFFLENESERDWLLQSYFGATLREADRSSPFSHAASKPPLLTRSQPSTSSP